MSSDRAKHWAWQSRHELPSGAHLLLLLAMADVVGETLVCYASVETLTDLSMSSDRTIRRHLDELEQLGKIKGQPRPGRTTIYQLLIPPEFGQEVGGRKGRRTPVKMTGVDQGDTGTSGTSDPGQDDRGNPGQNDRGTPRSDCQGPLSDWQDTPAKLTDDSSLDSSLPNPPKTRAGARAGPAPSPARAEPVDPAERAWKLAAELGLESQWRNESQKAFIRRVSEAERDVFLLNNSAAVLKIPPRSPGETLKALRARVDQAQSAKLAAEVESRRAAAAASELATA